MSAQSINGHPILSRKSQNYNERPLENPAQNCAFSVGNNVRISRYCVFRGMMKTVILTVKTFIRIVKSFDLIMERKGRCSREKVWIWPGSYCFL
jgi:hypothetical protein